MSSSRFSKKNLPIWVVLFIFINYSCKNHKDPYQNVLGIKPSVVAQLDTANYTNILWIDSIKDFGTIDMGQKVEIKFRFRNTGNKPLYLTEVNPSCGCIVTDYPEKLFTPGEEGHITATFDSHNHPGFIYKTIRVTSNTVNGVNHLLLYKGQVEDTTNH